MFIKSFSKLFTVFCFCLLVVGSVASAKVEYTISSAAYPYKTKQTYIKVNCYNLIQSATCTSTTSSLVVTDTLDYTKSYVELTFLDSDGKTSTKKVTLTKSGSSGGYSTFAMSSLPSTTTFANTKVAVYLYYSETITEGTSTMSLPSDLMNKLSYTLSQSISNSGGLVTPYCLSVTLVGTQSS